MSQLVIVESPSKAKTINNYLGRDYKVIASFGHVRGLPSKQGSVVPEEDFAVTYEIHEDSTRHMKTIVDAVKNADGLILATDPDREGEAISWHIVEALKEKKAIKKDFPVKRVTFGEITKRAVKEAFAQPREIDMALVQAQQARQALDYLVGFKLSPILWKKLPGARSAGRVQSVALRLICDRESEIERFVRQEYWDVKLDFSGATKQEFTANLTHFNGEKLEKFSIIDEKKAKSVEQALREKNYRIVSIEKKQARRNPPAPFTTSTLQQEAFRKLGFGAKRTMQVAQSLYEGADIGGETTGLITYMRTDGIDLAAEAVMATRDVIKQEYGENYLPNSPRMYKNKAKNAQEAHEAIRPTDPSRSPERIAKYLNDDELKLYTLIWKRLMACQMEAAVYDQVIAEIEAQDKKANARAVGSTLKFDGFMKLYLEGRDDEEDDEDRTLPELNEGENLKLIDVKPAQHFTEPPPRFTEASLVKKLEELGIGRPSTYASIISVLQDREYVVLEQKRFMPEARGRLVTAFLTAFFEHIVNVNFTANLEDKLDDISAGEMEWKQALRDFWGDFSKDLSDAEKVIIPDVMQAIEGDLLHLMFPEATPVAEQRACPSCKEGTLNLKLSKWGAFVGCSRYPDCNYTRKIGPQSDDDKAAQRLENPEVKVLGIDENDQEITRRKGPYGFYVQRGENKKDKGFKRGSLPKNILPEELTLEQALKLLELPREVGKHPESGKKILANIGRFGPYVQHEKIFASLQGEDDVLTIGMNRAMELIAQKEEKMKNKTGGGRGSVAPLKVLGEHPDGGEVAVYAGRYGAYVKHGKVNATLPKEKLPESFTLEEALELIAKKSAKGGKGGFKKGGFKKRAKK